MYILKVHVARWHLCHEKKKIVNKLFISVIIRCKSLKNDRWCTTQLKICYLYWYFWDFPFQFLSRYKRGNSYRLYWWSLEAGFREWFYRYARNLATSTFKTNVFNSFLYILFWYTSSDQVVHYALVHLCSGTLRPTFDQSGSVNKTYLKK